MDERDTIRPALRKFILHNFLFSDDPAALDDALAFQDSGIIDSMGMMQLIQFIESEWQFKIADDEMTPDNLDSIDRLVRFVSNKHVMA